jgi:hypothetical protein
MPIQHAYNDELPTKRKRTLNPKLTSEDNVHEDAVKRRKRDATQSIQSTQSTSSHKSIPHTSRSASVEMDAEDDENFLLWNAGRPRDPNAILESVDEEEYESLVSSKKSSQAPLKKDTHRSTKPNPKSMPQRGRSASVEVVDDDENFQHRNAGQPQDPSVILESVDDEEYESPIKPYPRKKSSTSTKKSHKDTAKSVEANEEVLQEDADEAELGKQIQLDILNFNTYWCPERLQKTWRSHIYAFFRPEVAISYVDGRRVHDFTCAAQNCKGKGKTPRLVRRYLDTGDKASTSGLRNHAEKCWGPDTVKEAAKAADVNAARTALAGAEMRNGSLAHVFERTGKGKVTYSHRQHTSKEAR